MGLPTVIFNGETFYEFVRTIPDQFEFETNDQKVVDFLMDMGYQILEDQPVEEGEQNTSDDGDPTPPPTKATRVPKKNV